MPDSAWELQVRELKDLIRELNTIRQSQAESLSALQASVDALRKTNEQLLQENANQKEQIEYLTKKLFGRSSESRSDDIPGQMSLAVFNEAEAFQDPAAAEEETREAREETPRPRAKKKTHTEKYAGLPRRKVVLDVPEEERICSRCGSPMEKIGEEFVRREFHYVPARGEVIEYYSATYKCPGCPDPEDTPVIVKGKESHPHLLHGMASASTIAWVMYQKYANGMPLYRLEGDLKQQLGIGIGRATLANWIIKNSLEFFTPVAEYFRRQLLQRKFLMADETPVQVLKEPGRRAQSQSYMWLFRSGEREEKPILLYHYSPTRAGDTAKEYLEDPEGYVMCDGFSGYGKLKKAIRTVCWAHIRRYLIDAVPKGKEYDYTRPEVQGLLYVQKLFSAEEKIQRKYSLPDDIKGARLREESDLVEGFCSWLEAQNPVRGSRFAKAVTYCRNRLPYLRNYLLDGGCSFTNNASERAIKPFVIGRKNWLFSDTVNGAEASAVCYSLIETAKANGVNPYHYLIFLLEQCPTSRMTDLELENLAPWNAGLKERLAQYRES